MFGLKTPLKQLAGIVCLLITSLVNGQNDKEAEQLLNAVSDKTASYKNISISFSYSFKFKIIHHNLYNQGP